MDYFIKDLVSKSYSSGNLDSNRISRIAENLNRKQLKRYIKLLKENENKTHIYVFSSSEMEMDQKLKIEKLFTGKKIIYRTDSDIISGIRIVDYDKVFEFSIRQIISQIDKYLITYD